MTVLLQLSLLKNGCILAIFTEMRFILLTLQQYFLLVFWMPTYMYINVQNVFHCLLPNVPYVPYFKTYIVCFNIVLYVFFFAFKLTFSFHSQMIKTYNFVYSNLFSDQDINKKKVASEEEKNLAQINEAQ